MKISKRIEWCMGHRLANHNGKCVNLHGHQYVLEVVVTGEVNQQPGVSDSGMVADFGEIRDLLNQQVQGPCDHSFMVAENDSLMMEFFRTNPQLKHLTVPFETTAENIATWIYQRIETELKKISPSLKLTSVRVWETPYNWAQVGE